MNFKKPFIIFIFYIKEYFFRKKTLNYILWLLIVAIIAQLNAINNYEGINAILIELTKDYDAIWLKY